MTVLGGVDGIRGWCAILLLSPFNFFGATLNVPLVFYFCRLPFVLLVWNVASSLR